MYVGARVSVSVTLANRVVEYTIVERERERG
jgi:hypothetical protein